MSGGYIDMTEEVTMDTIFFRPKVIVKYEKDAYTDTLFSLLENSKCDEFIKTIEELSSRSEDRPNLNCGTGFYTYLQFACWRGLEGVVKYLLENGADINRIRHESFSPAIIGAGSFGHLNIVKLILDRGHYDQLITRHKSGENILHVIIKGMSSLREDVDCLKYVLDLLKEKYKSCYMDMVNEAYESCYTPLHYAVYKGFREVVLELLKAGASIVRKDEYGNFAFTEINKETLEEFLNTCMSHAYDTDDCISTLTFKYQFLALEDDKSSEAEPLKHMSRSPDLRQLLKHPVIATFIELKWKKVSRFYKYIAWFYLVFVSFITAYVLLPGNTIAVEEGSLLADVSISLQIYIACYLVMLTAVEVWQAVVLRWEYLRSIENFIDILLIIMTTIMISRIFTFIQQEISAAVIFLSWTDIILLLGRHPSGSKVVEMYKRVTCTFLQFLSCYSIFVVAFVLSFYILFQDPNTKVNTLQSLSMGIFNATLSLAGKLGPEYIPFDDHPVTSHLLFLSFIVLICINLLNLLNGLAVSDTRSIIEEAELVGLISRVNFIFLIEQMANLRFNMLFSSVNVFMITKLQKQDYKLKFSRRKLKGPYKRWDETMSDDVSEHSCKLSREASMTLLEPIVKSALEILNKGNKLAQIIEKVDPQLNMFNIEERLAKINEKVDSNYKALSQILSWIEKMDLKQVEENKCNLNI